MALGGVPMIMQYANEDETAVMGSQIELNKNYWTENIQDADNEFFSKNIDGEYLTHIDTKNFAIKASIMKELMFDPALGNCEDLDLYIRLKETAKIKYEPALKVEHNQVSSFKSTIRKNFNRESIIIPNGLPVPQPNFQKSDPPIISWIANIKPLKKPEIFIKLVEIFKDTNIKFVYAGRPSDSIYQNMLIEKTKKLDNLTYLGEISFENINDLLSKSSLLVNTSTTEGFSNTYIQAWMRETPVITLSCDPDNIIKSHKLGFHSGSFDQLVKDVRFLIENEDIRREMSNNARKYAIKNHDIEKIGKRYLNVFENL